MSCSVFGIATDHRACLAQLRAAGFRADEISLIAAGSGAGIGGDAPSGMTWLPAIGAVVACGPLAPLLRGSQSLVKPLAELGVPAYAAQRYEDALARGCAVVAVHTENGFEIETVTELLRDGGCEQVAAA